MRRALPRYFSAGSSDHGVVRANNEDRVYCDEARGFFLVADGMGGHEAGEHAAEIAVERIRARLERQTDSVEQRLREAITLANNAIFENAQQNAEWKGMACVLTAAVIEDGQVTVGHVGDSRLYRIKRDLIDKITRDHSPIGEREDSGELTESEAMKHPRRNEVYRDVGSQEHSPDDEGFIEIFKFPFEPEGAFLLCSDGLSDAISSENILRIISQHAGDPGSAVRALIAAANEIGTDNVSAVLVEGEAFARSFGKRSAKRRTTVVAADTAVGESTDRLTPVYVPMARIRWYRTGVAYVLYGAFAGAVLLFLIQMFVLAAYAPHTPQVLMVTALGSIADALAQAQSGDTITVAPGTYSGPVRLKEGVTLTATRPHEAIIRGSVTAEGLRRARLEGFQVRGENAVRIRDSDVVLSRDDIAESSTAGVEFSGNSRGAIFACDIHNNAGAGILVTDVAAPAIENNLIRENGRQPDSLRPGLLVRSPLRPVVSGNIFSGNGAEPIWLPAANEAIVQRNSFTFSGTLSGNTEERQKVRVVPIQEGRP